MGPWQSGGSRGWLARQSSDGGGLASNAIDGQLSKLALANGSCMLTGFALNVGASGSPEWWALDLGATTTVAGFRLWPRTDCCPGEQRRYSGTA